MKGSSVVVYYTQYLSGCRLILCLAASRTRTTCLSPVGSLDVLHALTSSELVIAFQDTPFFDVLLPDTMLALFLPPFASH